jgi:histone-lysine N-methyltransferase SETMAR
MYVQRSFKRTPENWDHEGSIVEHALQQRQTVISGRYSDVLRNQLKPAIRRHRRGLSSSGVRLQGVNARRHTARYTVKQIQDFKLQVLPCPPHSPDLAPSDFHLLWPLKDALFGRNLKSETCNLLLQGGLDNEILNRHGM